MKLHKFNLQASAIFVGFLAFIGVYALGGMLVIFSLSILPESVDVDSVMLGLRIGGYIALAFPAYVTARAVNEHALLHAFVVGVIEGSGVVVLMMNTFSFDGTLKQYVISQMLPVFVGVILLSLIAGTIAERVNRKDL